MAPDNVPVKPVWTYSKRVDKYKCRSCDKYLSLDKDGLINRHIPAYVSKTKDPFNPLIHCPGSYEKPKKKDIGTEYRTSWAPGSAKCPSCGTARTMISGGKIGLHKLKVGRTPCAECDNPAEPSDYLCKTCRNG